VAKERIRETFNDGILAYGFKKTQRSENGKRIGGVFTPEGKLAFQELSCRESDYQMAGARGTILSLKVKTLYPPSFRKINKSKLKVVVDGKEYDVIKVDSDPQKQYLYFYLQEVGINSE